MPAKDLLRLDPSAKETLQSLQFPGEPDIYRHLVEVFLKTSDEFLISLHAADAETAQRIAHSWRSSSSGIGAQVLADLCSQIEATSDSNQHRALLPLLEKEYAAVKVELSQN